MSKQLSVYTGVRWESLLIHASGNTVATVDTRSAVLSPIVQMVLRPPEFKDVQARLGLSRTYKTPMPAQLNLRRHVADDNAPTTPNTSGNPALRLELAWGLDLALEYSVPAMDGMVSASAYAKSIEDVTFQELTYTDGAWVSRPVNEGSAVTVGFQLEGRLNLQKLAEDWPHVSFHGGLSWNWARLSSLPEPANRLAGQPPFSPSLGADYRVPTHHLTLGTSVTFSSTRTARTSSSKIETRHRSTAWDAYALWDFTKEVNLRISVSNLLRQSTITDHPVWAQAKHFSRRCENEGLQLCVPPWRGSLEHGADRHQFNLPYWQFARKDNESTRH